MFLRNYFPPFFFLFFLSVSLLQSGAKKNYLSLEWAKYIERNPGAGAPKGSGNWDPKKTAAFFMAKGKRLYGEKKYSESISKYQDALNYYATGELYYNFANSLWFVSLEKAIKAYEIAVELGYRKKIYYTYYNIACAYSLLKKADKSFFYLKKALSHGYKHISHIKKDKDLNFLKDHKTIGPKVMQAILEIERKIDSEIRVDPAYWNRSSKEILEFFIKHSKKARFYDPATGKYSKQSVHQEYGTLLEQPESPNTKFSAKCDNKICFVTVTELINEPGIEETFGSSCSFIFIIYQNAIYKNRVEVFMAACPWIYIKTTRGWQKKIEIIQNLNAKGKEKLQKNSLWDVPVINGKIVIQIREEKDEVSYIDQLYLVINGRKYFSNKESFAHDRLLKRDQTYLILRKGEKVTLEFELGNKNITKVKRITIAAAGYYEMDIQGLMSQRKFNPVMVK